MALYLVTGGAGFIGSHLCDALIARGDRVRVLDDLSTGHLSNLPPGIDFLKGDIADPEAAAKATQDVDGCFHLAAIASVERGVNDWTGTHKANLTGAITIFDALRRTEILAWRDAVAQEVADGRYAPTTANDWRWRSGAMGRRWCCSTVGAPISPAGSGWSTNWQPATPSMPGPPGGTARPVPMPAAAPSRRWRRAWPGTWPR